MSGRDLVDDVRSGVRPLTDQSRRGGLFDIVIAAVAVMAVGALAVVGYGVLFPSAPPAPAQIAALPIDVPAWTEADDKACQARGRAAAVDPDTGTYLITNRSISEGVAFLTTKVTCQLTLKPKRFCATDGNAQIVAIVSDYLNRLDLVKLGIAAQGAPMALAGGLFGGEAAAGDGIYGSMAKDTLAYMADNDAHVVAAIQALARGGVIEADAFKPFPFAGVPKRVEQIFANVTTTSSLCA